MDSANASFDSKLFWKTIQFVPQGCQRVKVIYSHSMEGFEIQRLNTDHFSSCVTMTSPLEGRAVTLLNTQYWTSVTLHTLHTYTCWSNIKINMEVQTLTVSYLTTVFSVWTNMWYSLRSNKKKVRVWFTSLNSIWLMLSDLTGVLRRTWRVKLWIGMPVLGGPVFLGNGDMKIGISQVHWHKQVL